MKQIIVMALAGLACALAALSSGQVGAGAVFLLLLAPFPIYVASLSFGTVAGVGASLVAIFAGGIFGSVQTAIVIGLVLTIPASVIGHQANLAQQDDEGNVEWFPVSQLFFNLCLIVAGGIIALGLMMGYDSSLIADQMNVAVGEVFKQNPPSQPMTQADIAALSKSVVRVMPFVFSGIWLIVHITNLYFAAMVSRASNMMPRPKDDIPATANISKPAIFILLLSIVCASFTTGTIQLVSGVVAGVFLMAFALLGLANMHYKSRGNPTGVIMIVITYLVIAILYLPIYLFAVSGVFRNINGIPKQPPSNNGQ